MGVEAATEVALGTRSHPVSGCLFSIQELTHPDGLPGLCTFGGNLKFSTDAVIGRILKRSGCHARRMTMLTRQQYGTRARATSRANPRVRFLSAASVVFLLAGSPLSAEVSAAANVPVAADTQLPIAVEGTASEAPGYPWQWPVHSTRLVVVPFRAPAHAYGPGHRGMDIAAQTAATVHAPTAGVVAFRGTVVDRPLITIDHGDGYVSTLEPVASELTPGDVVSANDPVGTVATGGYATPGTLYIGVRIDGRYVNPRGLFGQIPRAVLLPCCSR